MKTFLGFAQRESRKSFFSGNKKVFLHQAADIMPKGEICFILKRLESCFPTIASVQKEEIYGLSLEKENVMNDFASRLL